MVEMCVSIATIAQALKRAGFEPTFREAPQLWPTDEPQPAVWVDMPGFEAYAIIVVTNVALDDRTGTWRRSSRTAIGSTLGYRVGFHERPFRTRGHGFADPEAQVTSVFVDDVVAAVRDWSRWEQTWSVSPTGVSEHRRLARHRRLAASKLASGDLPVSVDIDPLMLALLDGRQADDMHSVIEELFLPGLRWRFPRDRAGVRLVSRARVLLHECAPPSHPAGKGIWLVADGPEPRAEQRLTIRLAHVVGRSAVHRWDSIPEYWRAGSRSLEQLWGIDADAPAAFAEDVTAMLLDGDIRTALARCGVETDRGTTRLLCGLPDRFALREWTDKWVANATTLLTDAAPWRWRDAVAPRQRPRRIGNLGGFNPNRRPGLFIEYRNDGVLLTFDQSASPLVVARVAWARDTDYDLLRYGLIAREQIPMPPG